MITFINKNIINQNPFDPTISNTSISKRISSDLWSSFSNLNFAGVYRIGSPIKYRNCYIGGCYNITLKVTHHLNLLYRGEHHSKGLQDWVNKYGIENIDISVLAYSKSNPDEFEALEQYYLDLIKPKFNSILNKKEITFEFIEINHRGYRNINIKNEFGNSIVSKISATHKHIKLKVLLNRENYKEERLQWKPTIVINSDANRLRKPGYPTTYKAKRSTQIEPIVESVVIRNNIFKPKPNT